VEFLSGIGIWQHLDAARMAPVYDMEIHGDAGGQLDFRPTTAACASWPGSSNPA
jgi:2-polyprenyl-6-methoxyphenol hydroxylase-like FAD-dependent oxidoreductase